jgi:hypothetical protein
MKLLPLSKKSKKYTGKYHAIVDDDIFDELNNYDWSYHPNGYAHRMVRINGKQKRLMLHRYILNAKPKQIVDHINRNSLDNRRENLRFVTAQQSSCNTGPNHGLGFKGTSFKKDHKKWKAVITIDSKNIHLGYFSTEEEAAKAYDVASKKYHGEYGYLNFPKTAL